MPTGRFIGFVLLAALLGPACVGGVDGTMAPPGDDEEPPPDAPVVVQAPDAPPIADAILQTFDAPLPPPDAPLPPRLRVSGTPGAVNLRLGPSSDYPIITSIPEGCLVDPIGAPEDGWMPVLWRGIPGWVHGRYLEPVPADAADCLY
jgi:hypothetical protein